MAFLYSFDNNNQTTCLSHHCQMTSFDFHQGSYYLQARPFFQGLGGFQFPLNVTLDKEFATINVGPGILIQTLEYYRHLEFIPDRVSW